MEIGASCRLPLLLCCSPELSTARQVVNSEGYLSGLGREGYWLKGKKNGAVGEERTTAFWLTGLMLRNSLRNSHSRFLEKILCRALEMAGNQEPGWTWAQLQDPSSRAKVLTSD